MTIKATLGSLFDPVADRIDSHLAYPLQVRKDANSVAEWIARSENIDQIRYPAFYFRFMREWHTSFKYDLRWVKQGDCSVADSARRFALLVDQLASQVPSPPLSLARALARAADSMLDRREIHERRTVGDVGFYFLLSSSFAYKCRLLSAAIRFLRPTCVLELGTAYGMSSLCMGMKLERLGRPWEIATVESNPQPYAIASGLLNENFADRVSCFCEASQNALGTLRAAGKRFDFFFHDAGHSFEDYTRDFAAAEPLLQPGAVALIDDIRWEDRVISFLPKGASARTHEGWLHIVNHPRVAMAAELNQAMGLALLN